MTGNMECADAKPKSVNGAQYGEACDQSQRMLSNYMLFYYQMNHRFPKEIQMCQVALIKRKTCKNCGDPVDHPSPLNYCNIHQNDTNIYSNEAELVEEKTRMIRLHRGKNERLLILLDFLLGTSLKV